MTDGVAPLGSVEGFDWDEHNVAKIWEKHGVRRQECEEVLLLEPRLLHDGSHSQAEERFFAFGETATGRRLTIVFTIRGARVRVVTARDQSRRERRELDSW